MTQFVLWEGPSRIDGRPIVALANGPSRGNAKTGPMLQTWIVRADMEPTTAARIGADRSVCGSCEFGPGRPVGTPRICYVEPGHGGPLQSWRSWKAGGYQNAPRPADRRALARGLSVRLGSYGDPAAVPPGIWHDLLGAASGWTGYTHQWRDGFALSDILMASTETDAQSDAAAAAGWRTFQVTTADAPRRKGFAICPNHASGGAIQCVACGMCDGTASGQAAHIQHPIHGRANRPGRTQRHALTVLQGAAA